VTEDSVTRKNLLVSFQTRINEIDSFLKHINDDERAALFENQNQRLRRACQSSESTISSHRSSIFESIPSSIQETTTTSTKSPSSNLINNIQEHKPFSSSSSNIPKFSSSVKSSPSPVKVHNFHAVHLKQVSNENLQLTVNSNESITTNTNASPSKISPYMTRRSSYSKPMTGYNIKNPETSSTANSPKKHSSYAWLKDEHKHRISNLLINNKLFNPCQEIGTYILENNSDNNDDDSFGPQTIGEKYIDVSIVLTPEELNTFIARNRLLKRPDLIDFNSRSASSSVHYNSPYVSHNKVMEDHFRPKQQGKWLHTGDIRPNAANHNIRI
jgi:hypothetical protein